MGSCDFISGWSGGVLGLITGYPFDTIKVNQQNLGIGMVDCTKNIFYHQGVKGYFRGMAFPLIAASTINSVYFGVYRVSLDRISQIRQIPHDIQKGGHHGSMFYLDIFAAGCCGGTAQLFISVPVEVVKIKLQTNSKKYFSGPLDVILHTYKTNRFKGFYQGFGITAFRDVPSSGIYMGGYALLSDWLKTIPTLENDSKDGIRILIAGGFAGMISWWSILPLDVIKSRLQADDLQNPKYKGWLHCIKSIMEKQGIKGFFRGFLPLSVRAFPVNAVTFLGYEYTNSLCQSITQNQYN